MSKNLFIALEGIDGSGKSSQAKLLAEKLEQAGHKIHLTLEPTTGHIGSILLDILKKKIKSDHRTIAALFAADRLEHLLNEEAGIVKKLEDGYTVITDRYYFSSYAYNGAHSDMDWVISLNKMSAQVRSPDLNIFIDVPPEVCMQRINANRATTELFEKTDTLTKVRNKYFEAFDKLKNEENIFIVDGHRSISAIAGDIWDKVSGLL
ncbi:MAG: Thymidylate kinase [Flavipsychrobacter sp.]|jgi:dTMP kinase|nr:Thymidylate kinase [Flavipsychrobacter sp.]